MKSLSVFLSTLAGCVFGVYAEIPSVKVEISNKLDFDRVETVELDYGELCDRFGVKSLRVVDETGSELPSQVTYNGKLIFQPSVGAKSKVNVAVQPVKAFDFGTYTTGKMYPQRFDDFCWENDVAGFRAYGSALQDKGERGFGYDLHLKRGTSLPVIEHLYDLHFDKESAAAVERLKKEGRTEEAKRWRDAHSYHIDNGYGMDCYAVGPTLGAGATALIDGDTIVYPWCYKDYEILDEGPVRFTVSLTFRPATFQGQTVVENRIITLDKGSNLNRTKVTYRGLDKSVPMVMGIVVHDDGPVKSSVKDGYMSYLDPTNGPDNGEVYMGAVFPLRPESIAVEEEGKARHLLAHFDYSPTDGFDYYWGFGWNRGNVPTLADWNEMLLRKSRSIKSPLEVRILP